MLACLGGCAHYSSKPLTSDAVERQLAPPPAQVVRESAAQLKHPILPPLALDPERGLTPDEAGVLAVILNPELRGERDRRQIASAQLLQAGLLPNPQLSGGLDFPYDSSPPDDFTAYNLGVNWEITSLIARGAKRQAATAQAASVDLEVAWKEWQIAQAARTAAYDVLALQAQLRAAREAERQLAENLDVVRRAVDQHEKTLLDLAAAQASAREAQAAVVAQRKDLAHQRLQLNRSLGLPAEQVINLRDVGELPSRLDPPPNEHLVGHLEDRRLDLLALKRGYESEDATLRAAVLAQFPKIDVGFNGARDTSNVKTVGVGVTIDIPLFDRNQGVIAVETATRQKLFDEYAQRLFEARSDVATAGADIVATNEQIAAAEAAVPELEQLVRVCDASLQQGNVDVLSCYAARSALAQKRVDVIKLKQQLIENWIALEIASGQYLPIAPKMETQP